MMPFFSVIVSLYNVEKYFSRGISCLAGQLFQDFEAILVDDGSTDETPSLCDRTAENDGRFKIIHQQNSGVGPARNRGLKQATGKYICFFDIDDFVRNDWLEILYGRVKETEPELLIFGYREINPKYGMISRFSFDEITFRSNRELREGYVSQISGIRWNNGFLWNKVYDRNFLLKNNLWLPDSRIQGDELFNLEVYEKVERVSVVPDILYDYFVSESGNIRSSFIPDRLDIFCKIKTSFLKLYKDWALDDERFLQYVHERFIKSVLFNRNRASLKETLYYYSSLVRLDSVQESAHYVLDSKDALRRRDFSFFCYCQAIRKKSARGIMVLSQMDEVRAWIRKIVWKIIK